VSDDSYRRLFASLDDVPIEPNPEFVAELRRTVHDIATGNTGSSIDSTHIASPLYHHSAASAIVDDDVAPDLGQSLNFPTSTDDDSDGTELDAQLSDDPTVIDLSQPVELEGPLRRGRSMWAAGAVAAAIVLVVGVFAVTDRDGNVVESGPVFAPTTVEPVSTGIVSEPAPPGEVEPVPSPGLAESLPYRWSRVPDDEAVFGGARGQWMKSVTVGGPGLVAVGSVGNDGDADAAVWTSVDGITWSRVPHDETVFGGARGQWMSSVTVGGPGLVAVGWDARFSDFEYDATPSEWMQWGEEPGAAAVWTSVDGITWSRVAHDETVFGADGYSRMNSVTAGGPGLVAVGSVRNDGDSAVAAVWTSVDGIIWSRVPHDGAVFGGSGTIQSPQLWQEMKSVTVGGPGLVAVGGHSGTDAAVWTSVDGLTWSRVPHDETVFGPRGGQGMSSVTAGGPGLVAVGYEQLGDDVPSGRARDAAVWTSVDGITWSRVPHDVEVFGGTGNQRMHSVTAAGAGLVAVGADGGWYDTRPIAVVWTSLDGITWSRVPHDEAVFGGGEMHSVTAAGTGVVAVGDESLESKTTLSRQAAFELGDSVFVWVAELID